MQKGYVPYLLRYSKKKPRYRDIEDRHTREYGPVMRGWHLFYDEKKLQMAPNGVVYIGKNVGTDKNPEWVYEERTAEISSEISVRLRRKMVSSIRSDSEAVCIASRAITASASGWCSDRLCPRRATAR